MATVIFLRPLLLTLVLFATILTGVALFTPSWRGEIGLISTNCSGGGCGPWWDNQPGWYQTVIILVILAFVVELVAVTWAALSWVGFCPTALNFPLGFLCAVAAALLIASITTFAAGNPHEIVGMSSHAHLGYSYWLAVLSAILMQNSLIGHFATSSFKLVSSLISPTRCPVPPPQQQQERRERVVLALQTLVAGRWTIERKVAAGPFGDVYLCSDGQAVQGTLRTEIIDDQTSFLVPEALLLRSLADIQADEGTRHFCRCLDIGVDQKTNATTGQLVNFNYTVTSLVGRRVNLLVPDGVSFSPGTAISMAIQLLEAIKTLHSIGYVHRDIRPGNLNIGRPQLNEQRLLYLLDLGMARKYPIQGPAGEAPIPEPPTPLNYRGTPMFMPVSAHRNQAYDRKDDVESWMYVLIKFYRGALPWSGITTEREMGPAKSLRTQATVNIERRTRAKLLEGCPAEFAEILTHIDQLQRYDRPNYELITTLLRNCLENNGFPERPYDWEIARQAPSGASAQRPARSTSSTQRPARGRGGRARTGSRAR
uniref:Protein kinase domain-containing protein n=1 Tax=Globodera rostochiensis TaxID=31243 RepID=A0A914HK58_GLORO